jgi:NAD(P)-dependent dehydrogenase (short-subunit alcohol dehydrogenase family)
VLTPLALVTGANRGFGLLVARALVDAGLRVAVMGRAVEPLTELARELGTPPLIADVTDPRSVRHSVEALVADQGPVDVLINNAGVGGPLAPVVDVDLDDWWATLRTNLGGTLTVTQAVLPVMLSNRGGRIVNIVSHAGTAVWPNVSAYAVSKAAIIKLGENVAAETRKRGVRVFNVHPGILPIGLTGDLVARELDETSVEGLVASWFRQQLETGRGTEPEQATRLVVRLARGDADVLSGRYLSVHDDLDRLLEAADRIVDQDLQTLGIRGNTF